jgi:hypothetical protein
MEVPRGLARVVVKRRDGRLQTLGEALEEGAKTETLSANSSLVEDIERTISDPRALQESAYQFFMLHKDVRVVILGYGELTGEMIAQHVKDGTPLGLKHIETYRKLLEHALEVLRHG